MFAIFICINPSLVDVIQLRRGELPSNTLSMKTDNISCPRTNRLRTRGVMALWRPLYRVAWCLPSYTWDPCPGVTARPYRECSDPLSPSKLKSPTINISWCSQLSLNALFNGCVKLLDEPSVWFPLFLLMFILLLLLMLLLLMFLLLRLLMLLLLLLLLMLMLFPPLRWMMMVLTSWHNLELYCIYPHINNIMFIKSFQV